MSFQHLARLSFTIGLLSSSQLGTIARCTYTCVSFGLPFQEGAYSSRWGCPAGQKLIAMPKLTASVKIFKSFCGFRTVGVIISIPVALLSHED